MTATDEATLARPTLTQQQKDALLGELLGDVQLLHQSVKDLLAITTETDERISARVVELRDLAANLAGARETLLGELALQASGQAQQRFGNAMREQLQEVNAALGRVQLGGDQFAARRFADLVAVAIVTGFITGLGTLAGVWALVHMHL